MNKRIHLFLIGLVVMMLVAGTIFRPVLAAPVGQVAASGGLRVTNALIDITGTPGKVYTHEMAVSIGSNMPSVDITVEARGFGESLDGSFLPLTAEEDKSAFSARQFITSISNPTFHLEPGETKPLDVVLTIPQNLTGGTHYAMIYISTQPVDSSQQGVGQILAASVPIVISPENTQFDLKANIREVVVKPVEAGQPIEINATVENLGNRHYKIRGNAKIYDESGQLVTEVLMPQTNTSIIPTFAQTLRGTYAALDRPQGLASGNYRADVEIVYEDGTPLGKGSANFAIAKGYQPFPDINEANLLITSFANQEPGTIDARDKTDVLISFEGSGLVTGHVAIGKYAHQPETKPSFEDKPGDGGVEGQGVKFVAIQVDGFSDGVAHISVRYRPNELNGLDPNSLFLAYRVDGNWAKLDKLSVQPGAETVLGDLPVKTLTETPLIALGGLAVARPVQPTVAAAQPVQSEIDLMPFAAGGVGLILIVALSFVFLRPKGKRS